VLAATVLFAFAFVVAAIVGAPAGLIASAVERSTGGRLTMVGSRGSLWHGQGTLIARTDLSALPVRWSIDGVSIVDAKLTASVQVGASAAIPVAATPSSVALGKLDVTLPAAIIAEAVGAYGGYKIGGSVRVQGRSIRFDRAGGAGRVELEWHQAATGLIAVAPLGSYVADLRWNAAAGDVSVRTTEGFLRLDGSGRWTAGGAALALTARPSGERTETLKAWLKTMAPESPDGGFRFVWPQPAHQRGASS
jgi:general secretion pathway protein N